MRSLLLSPILVTTIVAAAAGAALSSYMSSPAVTIHAQGKSPFAPGHQATQSTVGAVGTWFGIARPCPATGDDAGHAAFCQADLRGLSLDPWHVAARGPDNADHAR